MPDLLEPETARGDPSSVPASALADRRGALTGSILLLLACLALALSCTSTSSTSPDATPTSSLPPLGTPEPELSLRYLARGRGVDIGAREEIYEIIKGFADNGKSIVLVSSDWEELFYLSDRMIVMAEGRMTGEVSAEDATEEELLQKEKLQAVVEMAGAVCHKMNQPMQAMLVELAECVAMGEFKKDRVTQRVERIQQHLNALREMSHKLMHITRYETRDYLEGEKIIDIDKASGIED